MAFYEIKVSGNLDEYWVDWFNEMDITTELDENGHPTTGFMGFVTDQSELRGLLNKIWDLNMELLSVKKLALKCSQEDLS